MGLKYTAQRTSKKSHSINETIFVCGGGARSIAIESKFFHI